MLRYLRLQLEASGLSRFSPLQALGLIIFSALLAGIWVQASFGIWGLSIAGFLAVIGASLEALVLRAKSRSNAISKLWPEVIESLQSAASSGLSLIDSLEEISLSGPSALRREFAYLVGQLDAGWDLQQGLDWLKSQFGEVHADRLIELIGIVHASGGVGYLESLRIQGSKTRSDLALWGELESKQGWVKGTAKLAIVAPWLIVATLATRSENAQIYNSLEGTTILLLGLILSVVAYRLIAVLGSLSKAERVFAK
jgi:tight adherence protein B